MQVIKNTLYINTPNIYLSLDGENVVLNKDKAFLDRQPLHNFQSIVIRASSGVSPMLVNKCISYGIDISFLDRHGDFMYRPVGEVKGNVLLRKEQYRISDDAERSLNIAKNMIVGKIFNSRYVINRAIRDHALRIDTDQFNRKSQFLHDLIAKCKDAKSMEELRGFEGESASIYFSLFDDMILQNKNDFYFHNRNKRPPLDNVNALLSFTYSQYTSMCISALETVGLDPYVGFMHTDRPGRCSLALDLVEEFRAICDRFVLTLINNRIFVNKDFYQREDGAVLFTDDARAKFFIEFEKDKKDIMQHHFINEKVQKGMLPYVQAQLLARYIRGDLDAYPVFMWK